MATCRPFRWARRCEHCSTPPDESGFVRPHSKGQLFRPRNSTFRRHFEWTSNEPLGFDSELATTTGDGAIEPPRVAKTSKLPRVAHHAAPPDELGNRQLSASSLEWRHLLPLAFRFRQTTPTILRGNFFRPQTPAFDSSDEHELRVQASACSPKRNEGAAVFSGNL